MATFGELEMLCRKCNGLFQSKQTSEGMKPQSFFSLSWLWFKLATLTIQVTSITVWANLIIMRWGVYAVEGWYNPNLYNKGFLIYIICENLVLRNFITLRVETSWKSEHYEKICWKWNVCVIWTEAVEQSLVIWLCNSRNIFFFSYITANCLKKTLCCVCVCVYVCVYV
jgi:hypothetical protein